MNRIAKIVLVVQFCLFFIDLKAVIYTPVYLPIAVGPQTYYLDAVTGAGSDGAAGTSSGAPWATLVHADASLSVNYTNVLVKYPDGSWKSIAPVWHGFVSYYPCMPGSFAGSTTNLSYDIYNGHNGGMRGSLWGIGIGNGLVFQGTFVQVTNFASFGPTAAGAFIVYHLNASGGGVSFYMGASGADNRMGTLNPFAGTTYWDFGNFTSGRVSYSQSDITGQAHVWGFLAGGAYQAVYLDAVKQVSQNSNDTFSPGVASTNLNIGIDIGDSITPGDQAQYAFLISASTVADADYLKLNTWLHTVEYNRVHEVPTNGLALTPPMGWDSWRPYGATVTDTITRTNALLMVSKGLLAAGYQYVSPSDNWATGRVSGHLVADASLYPNGMASLGTFIRGLGLKYRLYLAPGITGCNAFPGTSTNELTDATDIASFGAESLMYDNCASFTDAQAQDVMFRMGTALLRTGSNIEYLISIPQNGTSKTWFNTMGGNEAWAYDDLGDMTWANMLTILDGQLGLAANVGPGKFLMLDFLGVGNGTLTDTEGQSNFSLWSMLAAPLFMSLDLSSASTNTFGTLTNGAVIAVDKDALVICGSRVSRVTAGDGFGEVYAKQLSGGAWAVCLFNRASTSQSITATWSMFGASGPFTVTSNLWAHTSLGTLATGYTDTVPSHGVTMIRVAP